MVDVGPLSPDDLNRRLLAERPRPLRDAASRLSTVLGVIGGIATALVGFGVLTAAQGDAVLGLLGLVPGLFTSVFTALAAFGVVRAGEPQVTPLSDPRDDEGRRLLPAA